MMIWGTKDNALDKKLADLSGDHVDNYTVRYVEGASHWVQQEEPEKVNAFIHELLQKSSWVQWMKWLWQPTIDSSLPTDFRDSV